MKTLLLTLTLFVTTNTYADTWNTFTVNGIVGCPHPACNIVQGFNAQFGTPFLGSFSYQAGNPFGAATGLFFIDLQLFTLTNAWAGAQSEFGGYSYIKVVGDIVGINARAEILFQGDSSLLGCISINACPSGLPIDPLILSYPYWIRDFEIRQGAFDYFAGVYTPRTPVPGEPYLNAVFNVDSIQSTEMPEPTTFVLVGIGLVGVIAWKKK